MRYMDDMIIWSNDKVGLRHLAAACRQFLDDRLKLNLKHAYLNLTEFRVAFLGLRIFPSCVCLGRRAKRIARKRFGEYCGQFHGARLSDWELQQRLSCLVAWLQRADTMEFRKRLFARNGARPI